MRKNRMHIKKAYQLVIDQLDAEMETTPTREVADISNFLQGRLDKMNEADKEAKD